MITLIAAIGRNRELGLNNQLLWEIPEDMKHFREYTTGKVVVMGRKTFESIGLKPLPNRENVVISSTEYSNVISADNIDTALVLQYIRPEVVIIGGASIYNQTIGIADKLVITHIDADFEADTFFPVIDLNKWKINNVVESSNKKYNYKFVEYIRHETIGVFG